MIKIESLRKTFPGAEGDVHAINDVSLEIETGELVTLLGPSGCGKTTTLRCVAGLEHPTAGRISIDGELFVDPDSRLFVPPNRRNLGMVFQSYAIWPHMSVLENVSYALEGRGIPRRERRRLAQEALAVVQLDHLADRPAPRLSGGQQQRVAIARALVAKPRALLFDEPLSNLDAQLRGQMRAELLQLQRKVGLTSIYVTHDQAEALAISDWIVVMKDGRLVEKGRPRDIYRRPRTAFTARFMGNTNLVAGRVTRKTPDGVLVDTALGPIRGIDTVGTLAEGDAVVLSMRPEDLRLADGDAAEATNRLDCTLDFAMFAGAAMEVDIRCGAQKLQCLLSHKADLSAGDRLTLEIAPDACIALRANEE